MRHFHIFTLVLLLWTGAYSNTGRADLWSMCDRMLERFYDYVIDDLSYQHVSAPLESVESDQRRNVLIQFGKMIAHGNNGAIYPIENLSAEIPNELTERCQKSCIVKLPHNFKYLTGTMASYENAINEEKSVYRQLVSEKKTLNSDPAVSQKLWKDDAMPICGPIGSMKTRFGTILIKPFIKSLNLAAIYKRHGKDLPINMLKSLSQMLAWAKVVYKKLDLTLDLKPSNLVWIEDQETMNSLGLKEPSFILIESGVAVVNRLQYVNMNFQDYLDRFRIYLSTSY